MTSKSLTNSDYTVGWICALDVELAASEAMLDEEHPNLPNADRDSNTYTLGRIAQHNVVLASLPSGSLGMSAAATVAANLLRSFPQIRFGLMVGIGGGAPSDSDTDSRQNLHLGDVVVSHPEGECGGVLQYDFGKSVSEGKFVHTGSLNRPPAVIETAVTKLRARARRKGYSIRAYLDRMFETYPRMRHEFESPKPEADQLFREDSVHKNGEKDCRHCTIEHLVQREPRVQNDPVVHYGLIGSANKVMKDAAIREKLRREKNIICFEMEAGGLMNDFPCVVVRGICDYCDSHKNNQWQPYAATTAAAYAKELLEIIAPSQVTSTPIARELMDAMREQTEVIRDIRAVTLKLDEKSDLAGLPCVEEAAFDSFSGELDARCHSETRVKLRRQIWDWAKDPHGKCIYWLNGMAGTGKSTIARTISREFADQGQLGASFFFKRGEGDRGNASRFFTTIAGQLVRSLPLLLTHIRKAFEADPAISSKTMTDQFEKLILQPVAGLEIQLSTPIIVVVDALDECENDNHIDTIIRLLSRFRDVKTLTIRVFLTSRPELPIRLGFEEISDSSYQDLVLHEIPQAIIKHDIEVFLRDKLAQIQKRNTRWLPPNWPGEENVQALVTMTVPLFIFAATICRNIADPLLDPQEQLDLILTFQNAGQMDQLDITYQPILYRLLVNLTDTQKEKQLKEFCDIVGCIIVLKESFSINSLATLLQISRNTINRILNTLHSILHVPADFESPIRLLHDSLRGFLLDPDKKGKNPFWIDEQEAHKNLATKCINLLSGSKHLKEDICNLRRPGTLRHQLGNDVVNKSLLLEEQYACRYWVHHLDKGGAGIDDQDNVYDFLKAKFLYWIEALSLMGCVSDASEMIIVLQVLSKVKTNSALTRFLIDAKSFLSVQKGMLEIAPLQLYSSGLIFTPRGNLIREVFEKHIPSWVYKLPRVDNAWNGALPQGHTGELSCIVLSNDGRKLASSSRDETIKVWDLFSNDLQHSLETHFGAVNSMMFSPDSKQLVSGSDDKTIKLWDTASGALQRTFEGHADRVRQVMFSTDGRYLGSCGFYDFKLWNVDTGALHYSFSHEDSIVGFAFSPDTTQIAIDFDHSVCTLEAVEGNLLYTVISDYTSSGFVTFSPDSKLLASSDVIDIIIRDTKTGILQRILRGHSGTILCGAFSSDGTLLASGAMDMKVKIWNIITGSLQLSLDGHVDNVVHVIFSPDSIHLASSSSDETVKIWNTSTGALEHTLASHTDTVISSLFTLDGKRLVSGSLDGTIKLWDVATGSLQQTLGGRTETVSQIKLLSDEKQVASISGGKMMVWNVSTGTLNHTTNGSSLLSWFEWTFSSDSRLLAVNSGHQGQIKIWDPATGTLRWTLRSHPRFIDTVEFSLDGQKLASTSFDGTVEIWDMTAGNLEYSFREFNRLESADDRNYLRGVIFSPDAKKIVTESKYTISLREIATDSTPRTFQTSTSYRKSCVFSPDGMQLAVGMESIIILFDLATNSASQELKDKTGLVDRMAFSPDGKKLASSSEDNAVRIWDITTGALLQKTEVDARISELSFQEDGTYLQTDRGLIKIQNDLIDLSVQFQPAPELFVTDHWIRLDMENLLWLPPLYRPTCSDMQNGKLVLGHISGRFTLHNLRTDPDFWRDVQTVINGKELI